MWTEWVDRSHAWDSTAGRPDTEYARRIEVVSRSGKWPAGTFAPVLVRLAGKPLLAAGFWDIPAPFLARQYKPMGSQPTVSGTLSGRLTGCRPFARELRGSPRIRRNIGVLTALSCGGRFSDNAVMARSRRHRPSVRRMVRKRGSPAGDWRCVKERRLVQR